MILNVSAEPGKGINDHVDHAHDCFDKAVVHFSAVESMIADIVAADPIPTGNEEIDETLQISITSIRDGLQKDPTYLNDIIQFLAVARGSQGKDELSPEERMLLRGHMKGPLQPMYELAVHQCQSSVHAEIAALFDRHKELTAKSL